MKTPPWPPTAADAAMALAARALTESACLDEWARLDQNPHHVATWTHPPHVAAWLFVEWFESRSDRLDPPAAQAAHHVLGLARAAELHDWLAIRLLVLCPADFSWTMRWLTQAASLDALLAVRTLAFTCAFDTRAACLDRLAAAGVLKSASALDAMLRSSERMLRTLAVEQLRWVDAERRDEVAASITAALAAETNEPLRRKLQRFAPVAPRVAATLDAAALEDAWPNPKRRPALRKTLATFETTDSGVAWLASWAAASSVPTLRSECRKRLERLCLEPERLDRAFATVPPGDPRAAGLAYHLELTMIDARPIALEVAHAFAAHGPLVLHTEVLGSFLCTSDETIAANDQPITPEGLVTLRHPVDLGDDERAALLALVSARTERQLFLQLERAVHRLDPGLVNETRLELGDAHAKKGPHLFARGWRVFDQVETEGTMFREVAREFEAHGLYACRIFEPSTQWTDEWQGPRLGFLRMPFTSVPFGAVPSIVFSETLADLLGSRGHVDRARPGAASSATLPR